MSLCLHNSIRLVAALSGFFLFTVILSLFSFSAYGQDAETREDSERHRILKEITETANDLCQTTPLDHTDEGYKLSVEGKAKVNGLLSKVVDVDAGGYAGRHREHETRAVLEKDIVAALQDQNNCRTHVFDALERDLLRNRPSSRSSATSPSASAPSPSALDSLTLPSSDHSRLWGDP